MPRSATGVLAGAAIGAVVAAGVVVLTGEPFPVPQSSTAAAAAPRPDGVERRDATAGGPDPTTAKAEAFLTALRDTGVPTSPTGAAEVAAAGTICDGTGHGSSPDELARRVGQSLPDGTREQARTFVWLAMGSYC